jgi:hypothetical protein
MAWPTKGMLARSKTQEAFGPPLTPQELTGNLSVLQNQLNTDMKCPAGRNQVYVRSLLTGHSTTRPRISLKCALRRDIRLSPDVFYEYIRDVCCSNPEECEAWRAMQKRHVPT